MPWSSSSRILPRKQRAQLFDEFSARLLPEHAARSTANKNIKDAAEVRLVGVAGNATREVSMQRDDIEVVLQHVMVARHLRCEGLRRVCARIRSEPVRLPVHDVKATTVLEHE